MSSYCAEHARNKAPEDGCPVCLEESYLRVCNKHDAVREENDALRARVAELEAVLAEVVRISDRKHDAWDRAHALLDGRGE